MSFHMDIIDKLQIGHLKIYNLFGFPVLDVTMDDLVGIAERAIDGKIRVLTGQINGPTLVRMQRDYELKRSFHESDIYFADGGGIVFASQLMGKKLPERVTGIDLMMKLMELAHRRKFTVYLLGAKQEVVEETVEVFARDYPDARVEYRNGYFTDDEEQGIAETIRDSGADMLFVGITTPKKENFLARWGDFVGVPFLHGVGGAFDVVAGKVERAPEFIQGLHLEWAYRIFQEPRRMWRREGLANAFFAGLFAWEWVADTIRPAPSGRGRPGEACRAPTTGRRRGSCTSWPWSASSGPRAPPGGGSWP